MADQAKDGAPLVSRAVNDWLQDIVLMCSGHTGLRDTGIDIVVLGYGSDDDGNPIIEPALIGPLAGRELVSISDVAASPARIDNVTAYMQDEDTGEMIEMPQQVPVWVDPIAKGEAPLCHAIARACMIVDEWISRFPDSFPPIIVNISSGSFSDGNPWLYADALKCRRTGDGNVLFMNTYFSARVSKPMLFPQDVKSIPDAVARTLFSCSSYLPPVLLDRLRQTGQELPDLVKCMSINAGLSSILRVLPFGTRW